MMRWAEHAARMGEKRNACRIFVEETINGDRSVGIVRSPTKATDFFPQKVLRL
jgi:hypothetical protein